MTGAVALWSWLPVWHSDLGDAPDSVPARVISTLAGAQARLPKGESWTQ
jgi:hypothetical protein